MHSILIHTDGGASPNPGPGGWGLTCSVDGAHRLDLQGSDPDTTNNRMELSAFIEALRLGAQLLGEKTDSTLEIVSDSRYVLEGAQHYLKRWIAKGFVGVKNPDLWRQVADLLREIDSSRLTVRWVKGHAGEPGNERADALATEARLKQLGAHTPHRSSAADTAESSDVVVENTTAVDLPADIVERLMLVAEARGLTLAELLLDAVVDLITT